MDTDESVVDLSVSRSLPPELSELKALTASGLTITPAHPPVNQSGRRVLRPRTDQRSYAESPDIVLLPAKAPPPKPNLPKRSYEPPQDVNKINLSWSGVSNKRSYEPSPLDINKINLSWTGDLSFGRDLANLKHGSRNLPIGDVTVHPVPAPSLNISSSLNNSSSTLALDKDKDKDKMETDEFSSDNENENDPIIMPLKELSSAEIWERERRLRKFREELRSEETKLILLKKLRQSQQTQQPAPSHQHKDLSAKGPPSGVSVTPSPTTNAAPPPAHVHRSSNVSAHNKMNSLSGVSGVSNSVSVNKGSNSNIQGMLGSLPRTANLPGGATLTPGGYKMQNSQSGSGGGSRSELPSPTVSITPSVTITPTTVPPSHVNKSASRREEDNQTPAQRQAAAKLALRKQLEKTLLQIPPPKPPPPEMNFIPNPSNTDFVYLVGLEHVVDYLTIKDKGPAVGAPFSCSQCGTDFTPVWKWEKPPSRKGQSTNATFHNITGKEGRVVCEQCVTSNVKKALKAEHTNRLKTAFVKALQQEQEIEQRLAQVNSPSPTPAQPEPTPQVTIKQATPNVRTPSVSLAPASSNSSSNSGNNNMNSSSVGNSVNNSVGVGSLNAAESFVMSVSRHAAAAAARTAQPQPPPPPSHQQSKHQQPPPRHSSRHDAHDHRSSSHDLRMQNGRSSSSNSHASSNDRGDVRDLIRGVESRQSSLRGHGGSSSKSRDQSSSSSSQAQNQAQVQAQAQLMAQLAAGGLDPHSHATMQALQHQLFRGLSSGAVNPAALMQFSPLLYPYHLAMAQAAGLTSAKGGMSISDLQRAAELQRQYLLDLLPQGALPPHGSSRTPWNNN